MDGFHALDHDVSAHVVEVVDYLVPVLAKWLGYSLNLGHIGMHHPAACCIELSRIRLDDGSGARKVVSVSAIILSKKIETAKGTAVDEGLVLARYPDAATYARACRRPHAGR